MRRELASLEHTTFDVVIIGGGISGACLAHDASLRGLSVALVERGDFGAATSAASSKLLHGGIRYLQQIRLDKVRESLRERTYFQRMAPHLSRWVPFLIPTQPGVGHGRWFLECGMWLYALLGGADARAAARTEQPPPGTYYTRAKLRDVAPEIAARDDVTGAHVLYESHLHSTERMTLAVLKSAVRQGAVIANYVSVDDLRRTGGRVSGVKAWDRLGGEPLEIRARLVANAAGPWLAGLNDRLAAGALRDQVTGLAKGAHIVTRQIIPTFAAALPTARASETVIGRGGRHTFVIPWRGHSLIGTTNRPYDGNLDEVGPTEEDIGDLVTDVACALPDAGLTRSDVRHAFAGLYPLTARRLRPGVYQGTGDYQVIDHARDGGAEGMVSALGAKYTTARRLAELATTLVCAKLGQRVNGCRTTRTPVVGGEMDDVAMFTREAVTRHRDRLDGATVEHLVRQYGTETDAVIASGGDDPCALRRLAAARESIEAEVVFAVEQEMAVQLADVVFRRTGLGTLGYPGDPCLRRCATIMASRLGWTDGETDEQVRRTRALFPLLDA